MDSKIYRLPFATYMDNSMCFCAYIYTMLIKLPVLQVAPETVPETVDVTVQPLISHKIVCRFSSDSARGHHLSIFLQNCVKDISHVFRPFYSSTQVRDTTNRLIAARLACSLSLMSQILHTTH
jgi:hypothetical protein